MEISRHFVTVPTADGGRRVHYRRCGAGPALLLVHQSPRSSAEYEPLLRQWGEHFTCIAPDTPGYGESNPLPDREADIDAFADALIGFLDAVGLAKVGAYGFHSGGVILLAALRRAPSRFTGVAIGGYPVWTDNERALFQKRYLPPLVPTAYGEHLVWMWNRVLEQSWFFPWFAAEPANRMSVAHDEVGRIAAQVADLLAAGAAYRVGYAAVIAAPYDIPPADAAAPPVLISAYEGDPLRAHLARLSPLPKGWSAIGCVTPADHQAASHDFLLTHPAPVPGRLGEGDAEGFVRVQTEAFDGLIRWRGTGNRLWGHGPGASLATMDVVEGRAMDMPGHGLSDAWPDGPPTEWLPWGAVIEAAREALGCTDAEVAADDDADPDQAYPDLTPDRHGTYLTRAWSIVRARHLFAPWYRAGAATALPFDPAELAPERLAVEHRALLQAGPAARALAKALRSADGVAHVDP